MSTDDEQLHEQQHVVAQPLEQAVDVQVFDALLPQERAGHLERLALELEEVEQQDQERRQQQQEAGPPGDGDVVAEAEVFSHPAVDGGLLAEQAQREKDHAGHGQQQQQAEHSGNHSPTRPGLRLKRAFAIARIPVGSFTPRSQARNICAGVRQMLMVKEFAFGIYFQES